MHITVITQGTQGDVQPYVALGRVLQDNGVSVTLVTAKTFQPFVEAHGLAFAPLAGDPQDMLESFAFAANGGSPAANLRFIRQMLPQMGLDMLRAARGTQLILANFNVSHLAYSVAEHLNVPFAECGLMPMLATTTYPNPHFVPSTPRFWPRALNWLTYAPVDQLLWQPFRSTINRFRQQPHV